MASKLNPWLAKRLKEKEEELGPEMLSLIVEVEPTALASVKKQLVLIPNTSIGRTAFNTIEVSAIIESIPAIERIPGVKMVHKNMIKGILSPFPRPFSLVVSDFLEGDVRLDNIVMPRDRLSADLLLPFSPIRFAALLSSSSGVEVIPTGKSRNIILDIPTVLTGRGVTVAVLDTGSAPQNPQCFGIVGLSECRTDPLPFDFQSHGCLSGETVVFTELCGLATLQKIWDMVGGEPVLYKDGEAKFFSRKTLVFDQKLAEASTNAIFRTESSRSVHIRTKFGQISATPWHEFYVVKPKMTYVNRLGNPDHHPRWYSGYSVETKRADELQSGDFLLGPRFNMDVPQGNDWLFPYLVGYILGDGTISPESSKQKWVYIHDANKTRLAGLAERLKALGFVPKTKGGQVNIYSVKLRDKLRVPGITSGEGRSATFNLPRTILKTVEHVRAFAAGYFDAEGNISEAKWGYCLRFSSINLPFLKELRELLLNFGVCCYIANGGSYALKSGAKRHCYQLITGSGGGQALADMIRPYSLKDVPAASYGLDEHPKGAKGIMVLGTALAVKIYDVEEKASDGSYFYSLSVPGPENYVASGLYTKNSWVLNAATGRKATGVFGEVFGIAPEAKQLPIKVLNGFFGFGLCLTGNNYILTDKGYRQIRRIREGDMLVNYNLRTGQLEPDKVVTTTKRLLQCEEKLYRISTDEGHILLITGEHPVLIARRESRIWKRVCDLVPGDHVLSIPTEELNKKPSTYAGLKNRIAALPRGENHPMWAGRVIRNCENCGKEISTPPSLARIRFCSTRCRGVYMKAHPDDSTAKVMKTAVHFVGGERKGMHQTEKQTKRFRETRQKQYEQDPTLKLKSVAALLEWRQLHPEEAYLASLRGARGRALSQHRTKLEQSLASVLTKVAPDYKEQYPIYDGQQLISVADFAYPEAKILIYADGGYWHQQDRALSREQIQSGKLEAQGWLILRFSDTQIEHEVNGVLAKVIQALSPVTDPIVAKVEEIWRKKASRVAVYDIGTELNHTLVANGIIIHNSFDILRGMERAVQLGARVINLSLGSEECQGGCADEDEGPCLECKTIAELSKQGIIFCIAAGNAGPKEFTIGCPGCSPSCISVGSVSMTDYPQPAYFSSRGPNNIENKDRGLPSKPDILAPGGGRALGTARPGEVLYSGAEGWAKGLYTGVKLDIAGEMMGTSQAAPAISGLVALLVEKGYNNANEIKAVFADNGHEKTIDSGWGVAKISWFI